MYPYRIWVHICESHQICLWYLIHLRLVFLNSNGLTSTPVRSFTSLASSFFLLVLFCSNGISKIERTDNLWHRESSNWTMIIYPLSYHSTDFEFWLFENWNSSHLVTGIKDFFCIAFKNVSWFTIAVIIAGLQYH